MKTAIDGTPATQINRIVSHPTLPMLITAHEDNFIRVYDLKSGKCFLRSFNEGRGIENVSHPCFTGVCTHSLLAHSDAVTSLDVDPSGLTVCTASHDCTIRFWDLLHTRTCIQEISNSHRLKSREGILDVRFHPTLPFVGSAGADGVVRIYG